MASGPSVDPGSPALAVPDAAVLLQPTTEAEPETGRTGPPPASAVIPSWLYTGGAWSWRLIVIGIVSYYLLRFILKIELVVLPFLAALVLTALLRPVASWLQGRGFSRLAATWLTFLMSLIVVLGAGTLVVYRSIVEWHTLVSDMSSTTSKLRHWLTGPPFHLKPNDLQDLQKKAFNAIAQHRGVVVNSILNGASIAGEVVAGIILAAFITFFLLYEGDRIWRFVTSPLRPRTAERIDRAATAAWSTLSGYIRGSVVIASFHAVVMAISLLVIGVPLVAPLVLLVFVTSFIPLIGVLVGGGLAVFVTLGTHGITAGIVLLVILVVEHQAEGHLLQPFVMGRYVSIHPLAVALGLAVGTVLEGVIGAIVAVPIIAMLHAAWPYLRESQLTKIPDEDPPPGSVLVGDTTGQ